MRDIYHRVHLERGRPIGKRTKELEGGRGRWWNIERETTLELEKRKVTLVRLRGRSRVTRVVKGYTTGKG